jgi:hypothetical protein
MSLADETTVRNYIADLKVEFPKLRIYHEKSWWLNIIFNAPLLKKLRWFNYTQTIGSNIWLSNNWDSYSPSSQMCILRHERQHLLQFKKYGLLGMVFLYLFVFFPIGLAYFRAKFEREGCFETIRARIQYYGDMSEVKEGCRQSYLNALVRASYLWAWPFKKKVLAWFEEDWIAAVNERK